MTGRSSRDRAVHNVVLPGPSTRRCLRPEPSARHITCTCLRATKPRRRSKNGGVTLSVALRSRRNTCGAASQRSARSGNSNSTSAGSRGSSMKISQPCSAASQCVLMAEPALVSWQRFSAAKHLRLQQSDGRTLTLIGCRRAGRPPRGSRSKRTWPHHRASGGRLETSRCRRQGPSRTRRS